MEIALPTKGGRIQSEYIGQSVAHFTMTLFTTVGSRAKSIVTIDIATFTESSALRNLCGAGEALNSISSFYK